LSGSTRPRQRDARQTFRGPSAAPKPYPRTRLKVLALVRGDGFFVACRDRDGIQPLQQRLASCLVDLERVDQSIGKRDLACAQIHRHRLALVVLEQAQQGFKLYALARSSILKP